MHTNTFIETASGELVDPLAPNVDSISIYDIAWSLSRLPRFGGHTTSAEAFNVAQHSIYVCDLVEQLLLGKINIQDEHDTAESIVIQNIVDAAACRLDSTGRSQLLLRALLHDAHEAYTGDIITPVKKIPQLYDVFKLIEARLDAVILQSAGLGPTHSDHAAIIKYCDRLAQAVESYKFMPSRGHSWQLPRPSPAVIHNFPQILDAQTSNTAFIQRFNFLSNK